MSIMLGRILATQTGRRLEFERELSAPASLVWHLLTDPQERAAWLFGGTLEPRVGGVVDLVDDYHHVTGLVTRCDPPYLLAFTWSSADAPQGEVCFELTALTEVTCRLRLLHTLGPGAKVRSLGAGWHGLLDHLQSLAEDEPVARASFSELLAVYQEVLIEPDRT